MRTTSATRAVERLRARTGNPHYSAVATPGDLFYLVDRADGTPQKCCAPLGLDEFVAFVDGLGPAKPRKVSKLDAAFEAQLKNDKR